MTTRLNKVLLVDAGNTCLKWADGTAHGVGEVQRMLSAPFRTPQAKPLLTDWLLQQMQAGVESVWVCHVLGDSFEQVLNAVCADLGLPVQWLRVNEHPWVHSLYAHPNRLGRDRWAALLAVVGQLKDKSKPAPVHLVLGFGTATTMDALVHSSVVGGGPEHAPWVHVGGFIIPGVQTMLNSLHQSTAQLPSVGLSTVSWPVNTEDAIGAGVAYAQLGMVSHGVAELTKRYGCEPQVWFSGGAASLMAPLMLDGQVEMLEHAVLQGLWVAFSDQGVME